MRLALTFLARAAGRAWPRDGVGVPQERKPGLRTGLIEQFVRQAGGTLALANENGTQAVIDLPPAAASAW